MLKYLFPCAYFYFSRVKSLLGLIFLFSWELIPNLLILIFLSGLSVIEALKNFGLSYLLFISFYELGYIMNDLYSFKKEKDGRKRLGNFEPNNVQIYILVAIRIFVFTGITVIGKFYNRPLFFIFYAVLGVVFFAHNTLKNKDLKTMTFVNLAALRFYAPSFLFLTSEVVAVTLFPVLVLYVFYRTLSYMDSKDLLRMASKETDSFKWGFYVSLMGLSVFVSAFQGSYVPIIANVYYLFWVLGLMAYRKIRQRPDSSSV